jgi:tetratricopeptide (TPR) repeat protein
MMVFGTLYSLVVFRDLEFFLIRTIKQLFLLLILLLISGAAPEKVQDTAARANRALVSVDSLLNENQVMEAVVLARTLNQDFQDDPHWNFQFENRLAIALLRADQPEEALPLLEAWVIVHPAEARGHQNLGACLLALGRRGRALSEYQQAAELEPRNANARLEYGQVLLDFRVFKDAGEEILAAAHLCGNCLEVQPALARYYQAVNQPANAVSPWKTIWRETGNPVARQNLLKAYLDSGQDREALDLLLQSSPSDLSLVELQQMVAAEGRLSESGQSLKFASLLAGNTSVKEIPACVMNDAVFWGQISLNLLMAGYHGEAINAVDRAIELSPTNVVYLNNRVVLLQKLGRHEEATRQWDKVLLLDPTLKRNND